MLKGGDKEEKEEEEMISQGKKGEEVEGVNKCTDGAVVAYSRDYVHILAARAQWRCLGCVKQLLHSGDPLKKNEK